ncbi:lytic transglycosylase domain-containing protein [Heyndrickxia sp. NPDC080065]|uniref:lytic transglycosylase domain-containing protein n=1 Tax=Heyndrickxia sp. NPDC080065 TaxID=3390568 RepID=UPI003D00AC60
MKKARNKRKIKKKSPLIILLIPLIVLAFYGIIHNQKQESRKHETKIQELIPKEYIPIYKAAEKKYGVPWYVLAAHHRVETRFSTMDPMISPVGAEGPMQFMPCTFVGWQHPTCKGKGKGKISKKEKEDPAVIKKYGGYGVDANGDGKADVWDIEDAIFSAANYLSQNGAANGKLRKAIYSYNHSEQYVEDVLHYVDLYKKAE